MFLFLFWHFISSLPVLFCYLPCSSRLVTKNDLFSMQLKGFWQLTAVFKMECFLVSYYRCESSHTLKVNMTTISWMMNILFHHIGKQLLHRTRVFCLASFSSWFHHWLLSWLWLWPSFLIFSSSWRYNPLWKEFDCQHSGKMLFSSPVIRNLAVLTPTGVAR